jgi:hypothetical protein
MLKKLHAKTAFSALVLGVAGMAFALNPIHESTYSAYPQVLTRGKGAMHAAVIVPKGADGLSLPIGAALSLAPNFELGAGLKAYLGDNSDISHLAFGGQYGVSGRTTMGLHLLVDMNGGDSHGLTAAFYRQGSLAPSIATGLSLRLGFLDALVSPDALCAFEAGYALRILLAHGVSLGAGLVGSSQTSDFNDHFALDLEPEVRVGTGRNSAVATILTFGLAGERRESMRVKVGWIQAF